MSGFSLVVSLLSIGISLYALSNYLTRRYNSDVSVGKLRAGTVLRQLSAAETAALAPCLTPGLTTDGSVRALSGAFEVHALTVTGGYQRSHQTIGGVEVLLPYDAAHFIEPLNHAEVVLASNGVAVVISLNRFTLLEGRARSMTQVSPDVAANPETYEIETIGQRLETASEMDMRAAMANRDGYVALCWCAAFVLLWIATLESLDSWAAAPIAASVVFSILALVIRKLGRQRLEPQTVDRLRGRLFQLEMAKSGNVSARGVRFHLGGSVPVFMPWHWQHSGRVHLGEIVELELRTTDRQLLTLSPGLSLGDEFRQFPAVPWGRALVLLLLALTAMLFVWLASPLSGSDVAMAWRRWSARGESPYTSANDVVKVQLPIGKWVDMWGQGRCELRLTVDADGYKAPDPDCNLLRWGGEPLTTAPVDLSDVAGASMYFDNGEYLRTRPYSYNGNPQTLDTTVRRLALRGDVSTFAKNAVEIHQLKVTVDVIDSVCKTQPAGCELLKRQLLALLNRRAVVMSQGRVTRSEPLAGWEALATSRYLETDSYLVVSEDDLGAFKHNSRQLGQQAFAAYMNGRAEDAIAAQRGGIVFKLAPTREPQRSDAASRRQLILLADWASPGSIIGRAYLRDWRDVSEWSEAHNKTSFQITGTVIATGRMPDGATLLTIDPASSEDSIWAIAARMLWFALAVGLALVYGTLFLIRWRRAGRRWTALERHVKPPVGFQRMGRGRTNS